MNDKPTARTRWVWATLILQGVALAFSTWTLVQLIISVLPKYGTHAGQLIPILVRTILEAALLGVSLIGLWRSKRWGWMVALLVDSYMCVMRLVWFFELRDYFLRNPRFLIFQALDFATLAILVHRPVRGYFLGNRDVSKPISGVRPIRSVDWLQRPLRLLVYFAMAVTTTCVITTFSLAMWLGHKVGGRAGFLFLLMIAARIGVVAALLFALLMTLVVRLIDANRLGIWLAVSILLVPGIIVGLGRIAYAVNPQGYLGLVFAGPVYLLQVWWLGLPAGLVTGFICFQLYPWAFGQPAEHASI